MPFDFYFAPKPSTDVIKKLKQRAIEGPIKFSTLEFTMIYGR